MYWRENVKEKSLKNEQLHTETLDFVFFKNEGEFWLAFAPERCKY